MSNSRRYTARFSDNIKASWLSLTCESSQSPSSQSINTATDRNITNEKVFYRAPPYTYARSEEQAILSNTTLSQCSIVLQTLDEIGLAI